MRATSPGGNIARASRALAPEWVSLQHPRRAPHRCRPAAGLGMVRALWRQDGSQQPLRPRAAPAELHLLSGLHGRRGAHLPVDELGARRCKGSWRSFSKHWRRRSLRSRLRRSSSYNRPEPPVGAPAPAGALRGAARPASVPCGGPRLPPGGRRARAALEREARGPAGA
jgi:hypothetical protein